MIAWPESWEPLWLSVKLAGITTAVLLALATPLAWWLARARSWPRTVVETLVALPLVLPPTVLGFYALVAMSPDGWLGSGWLRLTGDSLAFSFWGLVLASLVYSLPFVVQPLIAGFGGIGRAPLEVAATLGAGPLDRFLRVALPMSRRAYLSAAVLGFTHTVGEFGVVLMVGGNIAGETRTVSIAIYDHVESLNYAEAHGLAAVLLVLAFLALLLVYAGPRRWRLR